MPRRNRYVFVCTKRRAPDHKKGSCAHGGSEELLQTLKREAGKAGVDAKITSSGCFDLCWVGAAVAVVPDNVFLKNLSLDDVPRLVDALGTPGEASLREKLSDHLVEEIDFEDPTKKD